jgi:2-hydroxycyclohexanecarboxyl-CoA dehydrogenase
MGETGGPVVRPLAESVVVVAGGTSGIGLEAAAQLAEAGVRRLALVGRDLGRGEAAVAAVWERAPGADVRYLRADLTDPAAARGMAEAASAAFGRVDVLVNSIAGGDLPRLFQDTPLEEIAGIVDRNTNGPSW